MKKHYHQGTMAALICLLCVTFLGASAGKVQADPPQLSRTYSVRTLQSASTLTLLEAVAVKRHAIELQRSATFAWAGQALLPSFKTSYSEERVVSLKYLNWDLRLWTKRHHLVQEYAQNPPFMHELMCIHGGEAPWNYDKDLPGHNQTYDDGLQMDLSFQNTYAHALLYSHGVDRNGYPIWTGDHWSPLQQMWVAIAALRAGRGFYPWPNTGPPCVGSMWVSPNSVPPGPKIQVITSNDF